jgi:nucleoid-associated protein YgaU
MFSASKNVIIAAVAAVVSIFAIIMLAWRAGTATPPAPPQRPEAAKTEQQSQPSQQQAAAKPDIPASPPPASGNSAAGGNTGGGAPSPSASAGTPSVPASPATPVPPAASPAAPSFDVVRIEPSGETVVAGRAAPGSVVTLTSSGKPAGTATADSNGQFVIIPEPLKPGAQELALTVRGPTGEQQSLQSVAVSVPAKGSKEEVIVALAEPGKPTQILSDPKPAPQVAAVAPVAPVSPSAPATASPDSAKPSAPESARTADKPPAGVSFRTVEVEQGTGFLASGSAAAGAQLRLYLNDAHVAEVTAASNGQWSLRVARGLPAGKYAVRADQIDPSNGKVLSRAEVPFVVTPQVAAADVPRTGSGASKNDAAPDAGARAGEGGALARTPQNIPAAQGGNAAAPSAPVSAANPQVAATPGGTPAAPVQRQASAEPPVLTGGNPDGTSERPATSSPSASASAASSAAGNSSAASASPATSPSAAAAGAGSSATAGAAPSSDPANVTIDQLITATVVRGDSLWRISRKMLGRGVRYTQIYDANTSQIRDPHRIYPGQVLVVPKDREPGAKSP